jgi:outer membrane protein assembly factor BamB
VRKTICIVIVALLSFSIGHTQNEIAQWRGPERNGVYPEKNLLTSWPEGGPKLLWKYENLGVGYSSPVITSNNVYVIGTIDSISYVFNFNKSGQLVWKKMLGPEWMSDAPGSRSTPTIYNGYGYYVSGLGVLYCFNAENGNTLWSKDFINEFNGRNGSWGFLDHIIIDGDRLYCTPAGIEKNVVALNRISGKVIWESRGNGEGGMYSTPILIERGGKKLFINKPGKNIEAINTENGELVWKCEMKNQNSANHRTPIYRDGYLFVMDDRTQGSVMLKIAEDGLSAGPAWNNPGLFIPQCDGVVLGKRIFCGGMNNKKVSCIDWDTGIEIYAQQMEFFQPVIISADNLLYCYDYVGNITLLKPMENRFEIVGSFKIKGGTAEHFSHPVIKDGRLYVRHDNSLFIYNISMN